MWRNGDSLVNNTNQNKLSISLIIIGLIWIGSLYFIPIFESASSTYDHTTVIMNNEMNYANFDEIQTNTSEMLYDIYYPIEVGNLILPILISSDRNSVSNLFFDNEEESIIIVTDSLNTAPGKLLIDIPRDILDSKANGNDKNFTVMVDDVPAKFLEVTNSSEEKMFSNSIINNGSAIQYSNNTESRILMIEFDSSSKIIKINGTDTNYSDKENISILSESPLFHIPILINSNMKYLSLQLIGGTLNNTQLVIESKGNKTLFLSILPYSNNGKLLIDIPRDILDSKANGNDKNFTVMVDDVPAKFLEVTNSSEEKMFSNSIINNGSAIQYSNNTESRILMIEFDSSSKIIKINGTDTNYSDKGFQANSTRTNQTYSEGESQYNTFVPIIAVTVVLGVVVFYFLYGKNKLRFIKKFRS